MDPPNLNKAAILRQFDKLRDTGQLFWNPPATIENVVINNIHPGSHAAKFEFRVCPSQKTKPSFPPDGQPEVSTSQNDDGKESPASATHTNTIAGLEDQSQSDIDLGDPEWHIAHVNKTHRLIFNKYCIYRPQYILLTRVPSQRQTSPLELSDFQAAFTALEALEFPHYVIFNCGKAAGGSRMHKHLQIFETPPEGLLPDKLVGDPGQRENIPYQYFLETLNPSQAHVSNTLAKTSHELYWKHVQQCAIALAMDRDPDGVISHNVVMTKSWIITIPRRQAGLGAATANAAGFMGLVWVPEVSEKDLWMTLGPTHVLSALGVPSINN